MVIVTLFSQFSFAASSQYGVGFGLHYFSGKTGESLAPKTGTVMKFAAGEGRGEAFRWWTSLSLLLSNDSAEITSSGLSTDLDYQLKGGEFQVGMKMVPLASFIKIPVQPYFGINAVVQSNSFTFEENDSYSSSFSVSDSQMFYGYNIVVGTDIIMTKKWGWFIEIEQSTVTGTLGQSAFSTSGNRILLGFFFL